ncbi:MAG: response regulator transcription factor [Bacteroidota bacterium]|nr:response regulator transcription factor [Bacteroidota bacterium]
MKKILLIEDNYDIRENITELLELENYKVYAAENGKIGIDLALKVIPDLILCDITMPVLDGCSVFFNLNKNPYTAGIPFIFLTAKTDIADKQMGLNLGADDYLFKPFDDQILLATIKTRISKNEIAKEQINNERLTYIKELEDMLNMISHNIRKPVCTFLGLMQLIETDTPLSDAEQKKILESSKLSALELDDFTKQLTTFLQETKQGKYKTGHISACAMGKLSSSSPEI